MSTEADGPTDDLSRPLGKKPKRASRFTVPLPLVIRALAGVLGLCVAVLAGWILFVDEPYGGEPMTVVSAEMRSSADTKIATAKPGEPSKPDAVMPAALAEGEKPNQPNAGQTVTIIDGSTGKRQEVTVAPTAAKGGAKPNQKTEAGPNAAIDPRLLETSRHGAIPKIAPDGARPSEIYAKAPKAQNGKPDAPRIAIVIAGLGIGANATTEALAKLPPEVSYAFAPYGTDLERWATRARNEGHEVLLQVGMEPFDYPENDPGPQTLLTSNTPERNIDHLHWFLSRFQGYVGVTTQMGARFTATDQALIPVLREIGKRGLLYFDDGSSARSIAGQVSGGLNVAFARSDKVLDAVPTAAEIDAALAGLEATARKRGVAVGSASALPVTIDRISQWARTAAARGFILVPISAAATRAKTAS
jgi:polysaccharide deacetylase 2 family uncharacterized protein YibQ